MTKAELAECIDAYGTDIYSFCAYLTGSRQEAEDLYQDTFLKAVELRETIKADQNPKSYLLAVAVRIWKNKRRKFAWRKRIAQVQKRYKAAAEPSSPQRHSICAKRIYRRCVPQ